MSDKPTRLLIATHSHGYVTPGFAESLAKTTGFLAHHRISVQAKIVTDSLVDRGRDRAADIVMKHPDVTHLMFIDADIVFQPQDVLKLLQANKELAVGAYLKKVVDDQHYAIEWLPDAVQGLQECPQTGCIKIMHAGTGFMMIKRSVFEKIAKAMPELEYDHVTQSGEKASTFAFFEHIRRGRNRISEDYEFCQRWIDIGGDCWLHPDITLSHLGTKAWRGSIRDQFKPKQA